MIDKISLASQENLTPDEVCSLLGGRFAYHTKSGSKYHQEVLSFYDSLKNHLITVNLEPRYHSASPLKLDLNPSRFKSLDSMLELTSLFCDPNKTKITRLDYCVDIEIPVIEVFQSLILSRKKCREVYRDGNSLTGFYIGVNPEILSVYDKARELKQEGVLTRIELRHYGKKIPIANLSEFPSLAKLQPFNKLAFTCIEKPNLEETAKNLGKVGCLAEIISTLGAQGAYKRLNVHSNFRRDFGSLLKPNEQIPNIDQIYQQSIIQFMEVESDINKAV